MESVNKSKINLASDAWAWSTHDMQTKTKSQTGERTHLDTFTAGYTPEDQNEYYTGPRIQLVELLEHKGSMGGSQSALCRDNGGRLHRFSVMQQCNKLELNHCQMEIDRLYMAEGNPLAHVITA